MFIILLPLGPEDLELVVFNKPPTADRINSRKSKRGDMEPPRSNCQHPYTVNKQGPIPLLCLNCWSALAYEPIKQIDVFHALIVLVEAERLNTLFTLAVAFHYFGWLYVGEI